MGNESVERAGFDRMPDSELDLSGIWNAVKRKKFLIGGISLCSFLAALAFVTVAKPRYTGEAKLLVENQESYFTRPDKAASDQSAMIDPEAVTSQVQLITSRDMAREVIAKLNLKGNSEFDPLAGGESLSARILGLVGISRTRSHLSADDRILERYGEKLTVFALPKSRVISVEFNSQNPELAANGANAVIDLYLEQQAKFKRERASLAAASIGAVVNEMRTKLAEAEGKVEAFRSNSGLLQGSSTATISNQQLGELSTQLAAARNTMADAQAKARLIRSTLQRGKLDEISDVARDDLVRRLAEQRATLRGRQALEARTLGPSHPRMQELAAQLVSTETELRAAAERSARGLENDARIANSRVENILAAIETDKRRVSGTGTDQAQLRELELEAKLIREQLEANTTKYREALARQQSQSTPADARVISRAIVPDRPSFPKVIPILLFGLIGGLVLSLSGVVAAELLSGRALRPIAMGAAATLQALPVPDMASRAQMAAAARDADPVEALDPAAARLAQRLLKADTKNYAMRVLVCAGSPQLDAGFSVEPFARALSSQRRVVLVDFGGRVLENAMGLSDLIAGEAGFADIIERDTGSRMHLVGRGSADVEVGAELDTVIDALSQTYEFVFMLAPQVDNAAFALSVAPAADKVLIMVEAAADTEELKSLQQTLTAAGAGEVIALAVPDSHIPANDRKAARQAA